jgi:restriction endonuclease S subunit
MDKQYVVVKLISGETVMAMFDGEDEKHVKIDYPIQIKTVIIPELNRESISASPLCQFSDSTSFVLEKAHIVYIKKLHNQFVSHYKNFIKSYEEALIPTTRSEIQNKLSEYFDDAEDLTIDEINRRIELLEAIASGGHPDEEEDLMLSVMEGNDTLH